MLQKYVFEACKEINAEIKKLKDDKRLVAMDKEIRIILWKYTSKQHFEKNKLDFDNLEKLRKKLEEIKNKHNRHILSSRTFRRRKS